MLALAIKTDNPTAELALVRDGKVIDSAAWVGHRRLAETLHSQIKDLLQNNNLDWSSIEGVLVFRGPGSFTGLRIGISVANAISTGRQVPISGAEGKDWIEFAYKQLVAKPDLTPVTPVYGAEPHITKPKK